MAANSHIVNKLYKSVIDDVINNVREAFLDEGVEEPVLQDLKQIWEGKLAQSRAIDLNPPQPQQHHGGRHRGQAAASYQSSSDRSQTQHQMPQQPMGLPGAATSQPSTNLSSSAAAASAAASAALQQNMIQLQSQQVPNVPYTIQQQGNPRGAMQTFPAYQIQSQQQPGQVVGYQSIPVIIQPGAQSNAQQPHIMTTPQGVVLPSGTLQVQSSGNQPPLVQVDGANDSSDDEDDFDDDDDDKDDDDDDDDDDKENDDAAGDEEEEPLNSADDVSDEDAAELFEADNVVVCQYDKINRNRNKWKFTLKHGIMNLKGKDLVFNKSTGDADW